jgi:hypothetical protein
MLLAHPATTFVASETRAEAIGKTAGETGATAGAEARPPDRRYALGLAGDGGFGALRRACRVSVEFALEEGTVRVPARVEQVAIDGASATLQVVFLEPAAPGDASGARGVLVREDHRRAAARVGWVAGSILGLVLADRALHDRPDGVGRRALELAAGVAAGVLGGTAGRVAGAAVGRQRGYSVQWMRPVP